MTVQRCAQSLLVEVVADETNASSEHEQAVQRADLDILVSLFWREGTRVTKEIDKADRNAAVNVKNELWEREIEFKLRIW